MFRKTHLALSVICAGLLLSACALDGKNGLNGTNGTNGSNGTNGTNGSNGLNGSGSSVTATNVADQLSTSTPIKHVVVIFQENVSFDHYFATYPNATNPNNEPGFTALSTTPGTINTLQQAGLLGPTAANPSAPNNPNFTNAGNGIWVMGCIAATLVIWAPRQLRRYY